MTTTARLPKIPTRKGAEAFVSSAPGKKVYKWMKPELRENVGQQLNVKIDWVLFEQLDVVAHETGHTKRHHVEEALRPYLQRLLAEIGVPSDAIPNPDRHATTTRR
jgi:uncharacterized protein (DUF4415 family)